MESLLRHSLVALGVLLPCIAISQDQMPKFGITSTFSSPFACAIFTDSELQPDQSLLFIDFDPQRLVTGRIVQRREKKCREESILEGTPYDVQLDNPESVIRGLGLSVAGLDLVVASEVEPLIFVRPADGATFSFRRCAGSEGFHFFVYQGNAELWHEYYWLPYDTVTTCLESDFENEAR